MNVSTTGFFSHFPNLESLYLAGNKLLEAHFNNFDVFSNVSMPNLLLFYIDGNNFFGSIALSNGIKLPQSLHVFQNYDNKFSGTVQWDIFKGLYNLW